jgi:L-lactate dehydrogenase complex protein LldF
MDHAVAAAEFVANGEHAHWHDQALWFIRAKRDKCAHSLPEWEELRERAAQIKQHTIAHLADYLEEFEQNATRLGAVVHWARDAVEHNEIVHGLLRDRGVRRVVKSKSMLTEECGMNPYLERHGIEVTDTDLGEWIIQLRREIPSHIVLPAIHIKKEEVGELFYRELGTEKGATDPTYLTDAARQKLRQKFLAAEAGITGVNFAIAETGGLVVCTNEGNSDLGTSLPKIHIASMGIEKLVPRLSDLGVFLRLLARSATGQPITAYSTHYHGPRPGCELHIVMVDNGRSRLLANDEFRNSLRCIRCAACLNTCPVYRRSGGHSYGVSIAGPIGSIINTHRDAKLHGTLPFACTLCGSCTDVCPVKIDLHHQLLAWRKHIVARKLMNRSKRTLMHIAGAVLKRPSVYATAGRLGRGFLRLAPRWIVYNRLNPWGRQRELPTPPRQSFREWYGANHAATPNGPSGEANNSGPN